MSRNVIFELERIWKEIVVTQLRYYPSIYLEGLRKKAQNSLSWDSQCSPYLPQAVTLPLLHISTHSVDTKNNW
jgi:hypothetical protein